MECVRVYVKECVCEVICVCDYINIIIINIQIIMYFHNKKILKIVLKK